MTNLGLRSLLVLGLLGCDGGVLEYDPPDPPDPMGNPDAGVPGPGEPDAAPVEPPENRVTEGLESIYRFDEGSGALVNDRSGDGEPLNLTIADPAAVTWTPEGLQIIAPTILSSGEPASKFYSACALANQITVEAWVTPASLDTGGVSARIAGMSIDQGTRDFSLIQNNATYSFRLRTTLTDNNGTPATDSLTVALQPQHMVYTRTTGGAASLYLDGAKVSDATVSGTMGNWDLNYPFVVANEVTLDRPWLGTLHLVAVYCRALSSVEVLQNYNEGW